MLRRYGLEHLAQHLIICRVDRKRSFHQARRRLLAPQVQPPTLFAGQIDGFVTGAVQVEFEARSMGDDVRRDIDDGLAGERIFLAQPLTSRKAHNVADFGTQLVAVVNSGGQNGPGATLNGPPSTGVLRRISVHRTE